MVIIIYIAYLLYLQSVSPTVDCSTVNTLNFSAESTQQFSDGSSKTIGWIKFLSCNEKSLALNYSYNIEYTRQQLVDLAHCAITAKILTNNDIPGITENNQYALTTDICSNPVFALNYGYELSYVLDENTFARNSYSDLNNWIGTSDAKNRLINSCYYGHVTTPRTILQDEMFYQACGNGAGIHLGQFNTANNWILCDWDIDGSSFGVGMTFWLGFDRAATGGCQRTVNDVYQYVNFPTFSPTGHSTPSTTIQTSMTASQHSMSTSTTNEINTYSEHSTNNDAALNGNNTGAIIGLCVGSFIFLLCIILAIYMYINKKTENVQNKVQSVHSKVIQSVNTETVINSDQNNNDRNKTNTENCKSEVTVITLPSCQASLPSGWSAVTDTDGRIYYQNYITKQSQWKKPTAETEPGSLYHVTSTVDGIGNSVQVSIPPSAPPSAPELETEEGQGTNIKKMMTGGDNVNNGQLTMSNNNKYKDIKMFFEDVKIVQDFKSTYIQLFIENGFDTLESIKTVSNQDLICIGMDKIGHRKMVLSQAQKL
eukprot:185911_1